MGDALFLDLNSCFMTGGNSVRYIGNLLLTLFLIVRAAYSSFGDVSQIGTML